MTSPNEITLRRVLVGHRAAVNVVDFDEKYIVSASGDRTIKVWNTSNCEFVRTLNGHKRGIACLQYRDRLVVSGSSDNSIRYDCVFWTFHAQNLRWNWHIFTFIVLVFIPLHSLWDIECGACLRVLEGHEELVRCIRFDSKRIVSGAYDGKIKVWDLVAALDPRAPSSALCLKTLEVSHADTHSAGVFLWNEAKIELFFFQLIGIFFPSRRFNTINRNIQDVYSVCNLTNSKLWAVHMMTPFWYGTFWIIHRQNGLLKLDDRHHVRVIKLIYWNSSLIGISFESSSPLGFSSAIYLS